jgi:GxxExxY protein
VALARDESDPVTNAIIGACIDVHRALGPGLLESVYEHCLCHELRLRQMQVRRQVPIPLSYKGLELRGYRADIIVDDIVLVEIKSVERLLPVHDAQVITYLKLTGLPAGLLVNFFVPMLSRGVRRLMRPRRDITVATSSSRGGAPVGDKKRNEGAKDPEEVERMDEEWGG